MIIPIISNSYSSNSFIIKGEEKTAIVDPGVEINRLVEKINLDNIKIDYIILTHYHYDHIAGTDELREKVGGKVIASEFTKKVVEEGDDNFINARMFNSPPFKISVDKVVKEGDEVSLGNDMKFEVMITPGHAEGSISGYIGKSKSLFSGDIIFAEGVGRYDLNGGNVELLQESIERLSKINEKRGIEKLYSGHGPIGKGEDIKKVYEWYFLQKYENCNY